MPSCTEFWTVIMTLHALWSRQPTVHVYIAFRLGSKWTSWSFWTTWYPSKFVSLFCITVRTLCIQSGITFVVVKRGDVAQIDTIGLYIKLWVINQKLRVHPNIFTIFRNETCWLHNQAIGNLSANKSIWEWGLLYIFLSTYKLFKPFEMFALEIRITMYVFISITWTFATVIFATSHDITLFDNKVQDLSSNFL
jgi:hypothetical protein